MRPRSLTAMPWLFAQARIPPLRSRLDALRPGAFQLPNDARMARYCGAGPPPGHGRHRYIVAVLALDAGRIEIDKEATPAWLMFTLFSGTLGRAFLEGWYER
jgi:phosphatidylethanolamine-binding protein (PEBP) family uncharacterized protein